MRLFPRDAFFSSPLGFALLSLGFLALTNHWLVQEPDMSILRFDSVSYLEIARHAPELPQTIDVRAGHPEMPDAAAVKIPFQHAQRFFFPYLAGLTAKALHLPAEWVFSLLTALAFLLATLLLADTLQALGCPAGVSVFLLALYLFNPFVVRFYFSLPTYLGDVAFHLAMCLLPWGLVRNRITAVLAALVLGTLGRQTMLVVLPGFWLWPLPFPTRSRNLAVRLTGTALVISTYALTARAASHINPFSRNLEHMLGLWGWISMTGMEGHTRQGLDAGEAILYLLRFFSRSLISILGAFALITGLLQGKRTRRFLFTDRRALAFALMAAGIISQPILGGPTLTGDTVVRLVALAAAPLSVIAGLGMLPSQEKYSGRQKKLFLALAFFVLSSLHHRYSWLSVFPYREALFLVSQLFSAAMAVTFVI